MQFLNVPDVDAERNDRGRVLKQFLGHCFSARAGDELKYSRLFLQRTQIGLKITQGQRAMCVARVDGCKRCSQSLRLSFQTDMVTNDDVQLRFLNSFW